MSALPYKNQIVLIMLNVLAFSHDCHNYRILTIMPYASTSHKNTVIPLITALADRGHQVTFISGKRTEQLENNVNVRELVIDMKMQFTVANTSADGKTFFENIVDQPFKTKMAFVQKFRQVPENAIVSTFSDEKIQNMLEKDTFDVVLISVVTAYVGYPFAWHFNCPFILLSPNVVLSDFPFILGDSEHTEYVPFMLAGFTNRMNLLERTLNTLLVHLTTKIPKFFFTPIYSKLIQQYLPGCPTIPEIENNVSLIFTNTHPSFSYSRTNPPSIIEVGAIQCRPAEPLTSKEIKDFVETTGKEGFLIFAIGSIIKMDEMPLKILTVFQRVFARLPQRIIWQWESLEPNVTMPQNVLLSRWLPQQDLLELFITMYPTIFAGHPNCKGFLTHGGLLSTQEAVYHGVPVIGFPFVTDQENNINKAVADGYAIKLSWDNIDESLLHQAILSILHEPMYRYNVKRLQYLLRDQPETPLERAVFWTEYVIRNKGAPALELGSRNLSRFQRNLIDVYIIIFTIFACLVTTSTLTIHWLCFKRIKK